jgi:hypothetical protein
MVEPGRGQGMAKFVKGDVVVIPFPFSDLYMKIPLNPPLGKGEDKCFPPLAKGGQGGFSCFVVTGVNHGG